MSIRDDAIFLAGFITGTYDLKGEALPPKCVQQVIERIMAPESGAAVLPLAPMPTASPPTISEFMTPEDTASHIKKVVAAAQAEDSDPQAGRKKVELSPEEAERRRQRMKDMWARKRAEKDTASSVPTVTSMVVDGGSRDNRGNFPAPSTGGA